MPEMKKKGDVDGNVLELAPPPLPPSSDDELLLLILLLPFMN
jgi:hypothetical protein